MTPSSLPAHSAVLPIAAGYRRGAVGRSVIAKARSIVVDTRIPPRPSVPGHAPLRSRPAARAARAGALLLTLLWDAARSRTDTVSERTGSGEELGGCLPGVERRLETHQYLRRLQVAAR